MCGIVGFWNFSPLPQAEDRLKRMADAIIHRGPDSYGSWHEQQAGLSLGHRRLSILDLSQAGSQPMASSDGRLVLTYNGEIYNYREIRKLLDAKTQGGIAWRGHSDTEVLLEAISLLGLEAALEMADGMFAFGLWDRVRKQLILARDRFGEKPLYYGHMRGALVFGSELKALSRHPEWQGEVDPAAVRAFLRIGFIPDPLCVYSGMSKVPPGSFVRFASADGIGEVKTYWDPVSAAHKAQAKPITDWEEAIERVSESFSSSVTRRLEADVDVGVFLSGGIDSSLTAFFAQQASSKSINTYTVGFDDPRYDESPSAAQFAKTLGTNHHVFRVTHADALDLVARLGEIWDEPFADPSQLPTLLLSARTAQHVRVVLSGDGGDELFCGYNRHIHGPGLFSYGKGAGSLRSLASRSGRRFVHDVLVRHGATGGSYQHLLQKVDRALAVTETTERAQAYWAMLDLVGGNPSPFSGQANDTAANSFTTRLEAIDDTFSFREFLMLADSLIYLGSDVLTKVDRAAMSFSLETRTPFLNAQLFDLAWKLPETFKYQGKTGKLLLREILKRVTLDDTASTGKKGFSAPIGEWFRGPLRPLAEDLFSESNLAKSGTLDPDWVRNTLTKVQGGSVIHERPLWHALIFQLWRQSHGC